MFLIFFFLLILHSFLPTFLVLTSIVPSSSFLIRLLWFLPIIYYYRHFAYVFLLLSCSASFLLVLIYLTFPHVLFLSFFCYSSRFCSFFFVLPIHPYFYLLFFVPPVFYYLPLSFCYYILFLCLLVSFLNLFLAFFTFLSLAYLLYCFIPSCFLSYLSLSLLPVYLYCCLFLVLFVVCLFSCSPFLILSSALPIASF